MPLTRNTKPTAVDVIPTLTGNLTTNAQLADQGYTYNQAGFSYNQVGWQYGGIYNGDEYVIPAISFAASPLPSIIGFDDIYTPKPTIQIYSVGPGWFMYVTILQ